MSRLMNIDEPSPKTFYVFVGGLNPITKHNFEIAGSFFSSGFSFADTNALFLEKYLDGTATYLPFGPISPDCKFFSPYLVTAVNDYRIEHDAELYRYQHHPTYPSRLSAIYAFGDMATCEVVAKKHEWDLKSVKEFTLVEHPLTRVVKVNMEVVSLARTAYQMASWEQTEIDIIWKAYWEANSGITLDVPAGRGDRRTLQSSCIWEYLIEGRLET